MKLEQRNFRADPLKLKRLRITANMTVKDFQKVTELNIETVRKILKGEPVFLSTLALAVDAAFLIKDPLEVLHPDELAQLGVQIDVPSPSRVLEWEIEDYLSGWQKTSHGLQYQFVKLKHRYLNNRYSRGKCYELRHMSSVEQAAVEDYLPRHADVCEAIGQHPNIIQNYTAANIGGLWWVLDRYEAGESLATRLVQGPLNDYELRYILTGIAEGLTALHKAKIIRRELSPASVLLRESDDRPILTDLDLAKLLNANTTVSPQKWPDDPYRALEVENQNELDVRADIYSWGRLFVHAANGSLPERGMESLSEDRKIPAVVRDVVLQAVEVLPSQRPNKMQAILKALKVWA